MTHRLLLAALLVFAAAPAFAQRPSTGWGPSWVGGKPPGGFDRPKVLPDGPLTDVSGYGGGAEMTVTVWGDVGKVRAGHEYELRYQVRVHTAKGKEGPLLGTGAVPGGIAPIVAKGTAGDDWYGLEGKAELTCKELGGMTNLPEVTAGFELTVFLRVEPQLYDATDKKYLTDPRTRALVLVAAVAKNRRVTSLTSLESWVRENAKTHARKVADALADLDHYEAVACDVANALLPTLTAKETTKGAKLTLVGALTPDSLADGKTNFAFNRLMEEWAKGDDAELKTAAKKVLGEK